MSLEQTLQENTATLRELIEQLKLGRSNPGRAVEDVPKAEQPAPTLSAKTKAAKTEPATESPSEGKSSSGTTKPTEASAAPADIGESNPELDYMKDIAPRFSLLVAKDRPKALALIQEFKAGAKKLSEALEPGQYAEALALINEALED